MDGLSKTFMVASTFVVAFAFVWGIVGLSEGRFSSALVLLGGIVWIPISIRTLRVLRKR